MISPRRIRAGFDRHHDELMEVARGTLAEVVALPMEQAVRKLVIVTIEPHRVDPKLHRVLAEQIPRTGRLKNVELFNRENYAMFRAYLGGAS